MSAAAVCWPPCETVPQHWTQLSILPAIPYSEAKLEDPMFYTAHYKSWDQNTETHRDRTLVQTKLYTKILMVLPASQ